MEEQKALGNAEFKAGNYEKAIGFFTKAIELEANHVLYSNRSACWCAMGFGEKALNDADACVKRAPKWAKGHSRRGAVDGHADRHRGLVVLVRRHVDVELQSLAERAALRRPRVDSCLVPRLDRRFRDGVPRAVRGLREALDAVRRGLVVEGPHRTDGRHVDGPCLLPPGGADAISRPAEARDRVRLGRQHPLRQR